MVLKNKVIVSVLIFILVLVGYAWKEQNQKLKIANAHKEKVHVLAKAVEANKSELMVQSTKRALIQRKALTNYKLLNDPIKKLFVDLEKIQFQTQKDFNDYELLQNQIQKLIAKKIVQDINSINKDIKELEWSEKTLNEVRLKYSKAEVDLSKLKNRIPVTFLSDVQLIQAQQHNK